MSDNDTDDIDRECADLPAVEQVVQAMAEARHHEEHFRAFRHVAQFIGHRALGREVSKITGDALGVIRRDIRETDPNKGLTCFARRRTRTHR